MKLVLFTHPSFESHQSMPRYANMLYNGMKERGHSVQVWSPRPLFVRLPAPRPLKKWLGYVDQFIVFPLQAKIRINKLTSDTLFVFTDHALGPWLPLVAHRHHVVHCHDFLAQYSALGVVPENPTAWSGKQYQRLIRWGYSKGKNFISVSKKTQADLHEFIGPRDSGSWVVYNGLNQSFAPQDMLAARKQLQLKIGIDLSVGYILHVGGNQWYKNRAGVVELYSAWRKSSETKVPLLLIGESPTDELLFKQKQSPFSPDIHFLTHVEDEFVRLAYAGASVFLFPSLDEGFGWPVAEAMASGCPVITTDKAPMTEVAGNAGFLIGRKPTDKLQADVWAVLSSEVIRKIFALTPEERKERVRSGYRNVERFDAPKALDQIEMIYKDIIGADTNGVNN